MRLVMLRARSANCILLVLIFCLQFLGFQRVFANNGSVAIASPVSNITIDGDFSDWPASVPRVPLGLNLYGSPASAEDDFEADYRVGFNEANMKLYVALRVRDDSVHIESTEHEAVAWNTHDGCGIAFNVDHGADGATAGFFGLRGEEPSIGGINGDVATTNQLSAGAGIRRYEFSFDLKELGLDDLSQPMTFVWSVVAMDKDEDGSFSVWFWSPEINKMVSQERLGDLIVGARDFGTVQGELANEQVRDQLGPLLIDFHSLTDQKLNLRFLSERGGKYQIKLPTGKYRRTIANEETAVAAILTVSADQITVDKIQSSHQIVHATPLPAPQVSRVESLLDSQDRSEDRDSGNLSYELTSDSGLLGSGVNAFAKNHEGSLWIASDEGLARLDGALTYSFSERLEIEMSDVWFDQNTHSTWIAANSLVGYIDENDLFHRFSLIKGGLCVGSDHEDNIVIGTKDGVYLWDHRQLKYFGLAEGLPSRRVNAVVSDRSRKRTWIGTDQGLLAFDGEAFELFGPDQGLKDPRVVSLFVDDEGTLWIGTSSSLYRYEDEFELVRKHPSEQERYARDFAAGPDGTVYVATVDGVVSFKDGTETALHMPNQAFDAVFCAADYQLWAGPETGNLCRIDMATSLVRSVPDAEYGAIDQQGGTLWFKETVEKSFLCRLEPNGVIARFEAPQPIDLIHAGPHSIWVSHWGDGSKDPHSISRFREGKFDSYEVPYEVHDFCYGSQGVLWIVGSRGLAKFENGEVSLLKGQNLPNVNMYQIEQMSDGRLATAAVHGVYLVTIDDSQVEVESLLAGQGLESNLVTGMHVDDEDRLWIGMINGGIQCLDHGEIRNYSTADGLLSMDVGHQLSGGKIAGGYELWGGSLHGVNRIDVKTGNIQTINTLHSMGLIYGTAMIENDVWLASKSGIWRYRKSHSPVTLTLDNVASDRKLGPVSTVSTTTDVSSVSFDFHAVSLKSEPDGVRYQYRFGSEDEPWTTTTQEQITLEIASPLTTSFQVRAIDRDLRVSESESVDIVVTRPFFRWATQGAFLFTCCTTGLLLILHFARTYRAKERLEESVAERTLELNEEIRLRESEEKKRLAVQEELHHNRKMQSLGTLATGVAHDFNNALFAIGANAELALLSEDDGEKDKYLSTVLAVSSQAADLTKSMLLLGGKAPQEVKPVNLSVVARETLKILERTLPALIDIHADLPDTEVWCMGDSSQLQQVIINLCINARDAMPQGGTLLVEVTRRSVELGTISIRDTGTGMSAATKARAFEPFFSSKPRTKGTGLGLSIVHSIVSDHQGTIRIDSKEGEGTTFVITLPLIDRPRSLSDSRVGLEGPLVGRVLVVDDNESVRSIVAMMLEKAGLSVCQAEDGEALLQKFGSDPSGVDLLVVDVDMPKRDGISALQEARSLRPDLCAIVISGLPDDSPNDAQTLFLRKPFSRDTLLSNVERLLTTKDYA